MSFKLVYKTTNMLSWESYSLATIREVAKRAHVSVATVSAVINNTKRVSPEVRDRVEAAIAELDYRPNALARGLFKGRTKTIALLVPAISNHAFSDNLLAIEEYANQHGYAVFIANTMGSKDLADQYSDRLIEARVDGVLITMTWELARLELVERFARHGIPVVGLSGARTLPSIDCFIVDERKAGFDLGRYLTVLGHRSCAFIGPRQSAVASMRLEGLGEAFASAGHTFHNEFISVTDKYDVTGGKEAMASLLSRGVQCSCIVAFNDLLAVGALSVLQSQGFAVPHDISLATFGDHYAHLSVPPLTTMVHSDFELGKLAVERLLEQIDASTPSTSAPHHVRSVHKRLVIRDSTRSIS